MAKTTRNFVRGKMNKELDERIVPNGEYIDALNIRMGSTENDDAGVVENAKGNVQLTAIQYEGNQLSDDALCIGAFEDGARETIYWMIHDPSFVSSPTGKLDLIVSYNTVSSTIIYHVISIDDGDGADTTLNFNPQYLVNSINMVENLLFFTDAFNQPRRIDVEHTYGAPVASVDGFTAEEVLVIRKPPNTSPSVGLSQTDQDQDFLSERYICFGYRWRYANNEYSATSQFSAPAFTPSVFDFSNDNFLNEGMVNLFNMAEVTVKTGNNLVVGIDLLFKEADNSIIRVIERLDKDILGIPDNSDYTFSFTNSKIATILPDSEILRLYDNVPRTAVAQTLMGNRIHYSNYVEGNNLIDISGNETRITYIASLVSSKVQTLSIPSSTSTGDYTFGGAVSVFNSVSTFDLDGADLKEGSIISFEFTFSNTTAFTLDPISTPTPAPASVSSFARTFIFTLPQDYSSVYDLATSQQFLDAVGTSLNILPVYDAINPTSCDGNTFTDLFNCAFQETLGVYAKYESGIGSGQEPIEIVSSIGDTEISFQFPAMRWVDNVALPAFNVYSYMSATEINCIFTTPSSVRSLHSNRGYEMSIVYMDEFKRATTDLVSPSNTIYVPCENSDLKNQARITIPTTQIAPSWAKTYKFGIKPDRDGYQTVMSNTFVRSSDGNDVYFLLQGENAAKVDVGDRLIVKKDSDGRVGSCKTVTVLEKEAKEAGFLSSEVPQGVYMKVKTGSLSLIEFEQGVVDYTLINKVSSPNNPTPNFPQVNQPMNYTAGFGTDFTVPTGAKIDFEISFNRGGYPDDSSWNVDYLIKKFLTSTSNYNNMYDWFVGDNVDTQMQQGLNLTDSALSPTIFFDPTVATSLFTTAPVINAQPNIIWMQFARIGAGDGQLYLLIRGVQGFGSNNQSYISCKFTVNRYDSTVVFETEPLDSIPDLFYESDECFDIDSNGQHMGNVQDQNIGIGQPAIIDTSFFNCFAFGNGVESYRVRDSVAGKIFNLGNRATQTAGKDYREVHRFADITYSGVYNQESNVNKLNEFNLGLLNFKPLEQSFGATQVLQGRKTDILVIQEDKISYVLAGKNLLSDSSGGGTLTSVPEVLGQQIAREEEYGISENPESFIKWGESFFFTDMKRGAVIKLTGNGQGQSLELVSDTGMKTWFRDLAIDSFNTQKLGGYDPYTNEYVLSSNDKELPVNQVNLNCGSIQTYFIESGSVLTYTVNIGEAIGSVDIDYSFIPDGSVNVTAVWDGNTYQTGVVTTSGTLTFNKNSSRPTTVEVSILAQEDTTLEVVVGCPRGLGISVIEVCVTNLDNSGKLIHNEFMFMEGVYNSPTQSNQIQFDNEPLNPIVSQYQVTTGFMGEGVIPPYGSTVRVFSNKIANDNYNFNSGDNLRWFYSNVLYENNQTDISALLAASTDITPIVNSGDANYGDFSMPLTSALHLYIIYDYRKKNTTTNLCYNATNADDACCRCF
jgi:hypothetical protein